MSDLGDALAKHGGNVHLVVLHEPFESWPIGQAMRLLAMQARELAAFREDLRMHVARTTKP